jgi:hypothetical protein
MRELDYRKRQGELVERDQVEKEFVARILAFKNSLLALERSLPPDLIHCKSEGELAAVLQRAHRSLLKQYSRPLPRHLRPVQNE